MTQILARSVLALFASSALVASATAATSSVHATPAVMRVLRLVGLDDQLDIVDEP